MIFVALLALVACERQEHRPLRDRIPLLQADLTRAENLRGHRIVVLDQTDADSVTAELFACDGNWSAHGGWGGQAGSYTADDGEICVQVEGRSHCRPYSATSHKVIRLGSSHYRVEPVLGEFCDEGNVLTEDQLRATLIGATMSYQAGMVAETFCPDGRWIKSHSEREVSTYEIRGDAFCVGNICRQVRQHGGRFETSLHFAQPSSVEAFFEPERVCDD